MKVTIKRKPGRPAPEGIEIATCYALRHRHLVSGYLVDGCRCPSTIAAHDLAVERKQAFRAAADAREAQEIASRKAQREAHAALPLEIRDREIDDCPALRHSRPDGRWKAYTRDGCRCPSTVKAYERRRELVRGAQARHRARRREAKIRSESNRVAQFNLSRANRLDAEAIVQGYRIGRTSMHTRGLAILMMLRGLPQPTVGQIADRLTLAGQSLTHGKPVSVRTVERYVAALKLKEARRGNPLVLVADTVPRGIAA